MTLAPVNYGGQRSLPVHSSIEDPTADFDSGLLVRIHVALLGLRDGQILRVSSPNPAVTDQLRAFDAATDHAILTVQRDESRVGWTNHYLRKGRARTDWADAALPELGAAPTIESLMPRRLWLYTNYDCNLACDYCCVVAGPRADPRRLPAERMRDLSVQAHEAGMERVFLTGGEPTLRPDLPELIEFVTDRLPLTLLTNAMLLKGPRWDRIRPLIDIGRPIAFQVSIDSAGPELHDAHRGRDAHRRALIGIQTLLEAGARVRLAASLPEAHLDEIPALHQLADSLGIAQDDRIFRPIALRGAATEGEPIRPQDIAPELTADAQGWFWHPLSNDPDMRIGVPADAPLAEAMIVVHDRLTTMVATESGRLERFTCG